MTLGNEAPAALNDTSPDIEEGPRPTVQSYWVGLGLAILLTIASFAVATTHGVWAPSLSVLLAVVAIAQMGVHLVFFLHVSSSPDSTNTILALAFGIFVVALVVFGTMIIMANLETHAVSMEELMRMQR
jgi:cytochrome o ubiquinol oxidase operon protein cyoD